MMQRNMLSTEQLSELAKRLIESARFLAVSERQGIASSSEAAWEVANALADIFSASSHLADIIPGILAAELTDDELDERLHEVGEELRHILYHVRDTRYFRYVFEESPTPGST